ncbi:MAG TPA: flavodoxin family protein [Anaerolineaceae bacterium]|jgi:multimeric flavodoxin WrbA|nr:flavodoxin family protein [Anaerolineaceae bacterium]HOG77742.1 flavodoxin family protein [Anaerolineaceae bacterium]
MNVLLVNGSPHKDGNTYKSLKLLGDVLEKHAVTTSIFQIGAGKVRGCLGCDNCAETQRCMYKDDLCNSLIEAILKADGVVIGSPVYFAGPNGALCALLDRVFYAATNQANIFAHKPAAAVVNCYRAGATAALDRLNKYFTISEMLVVSSNYWNLIVDADPNRVEKDAYGRETLEKLAQNMVWTLERIVN